MIKSTPLPNFKVFATLLVVAFLAASCGSYQQASYYDDGIYSSGNRVVHVEKKSAEAVRLEQQESNIYGDYFGAKADEYAEILDGEIFTDVDSYSSNMQNDSIPYGEQTDYFAYNNTYNGNPGWGDNPTSLTINVYDNWGWGGYYGWNSPYWGWGYGWGGYPYYNWGWNSPWRYNRWGWNSWGWGGYYGGWNSPYWGWGYAGNWGWGGYYNYGWRPYYYNNYYGRNYAYNYSRGRRGYSSSVIPGTSLRGRSNLASRTSGYSSRYRTDSGRSNRSVGTSASRTSRAYSNGTTARRAVSADAIARNQNYRSSRSTRTTPNYNNSSRTYRSYGTSPSSRSNGSYNRSSGSVNRSSSSSSPAYRSSGRSTRSYQSSPRSTAPSRSNYSRSSSGSSSRSSYSRSSSGSSSRSYSSGGSSSRSSGGASRSSGGSRGGRGNGRN